MALANHIINWYIGNCLRSPNNGIRDESFDVENKNWKPEWFDDIERLRKELGKSLMTYSNFMKMVRERGMHEKYYSYKKYKNHCKACRLLGLN